MQGSLPWSFRYLLPWELALARWKLSWRVHSIKRRSYRLSKLQLPCQKDPIAILSFSTSQCMYLQIPCFIKLIALVSWQPGRHMVMMRDWFKNPHSEAKPSYHTYEIKIMRPFESYLKHPILLILPELPASHSRTRRPRVYNKLWSTIGAKLKLPARKPNARTINTTQTPKICQKAAWNFCTSWDPWVQYPGSIDIDIRLHA